MSEKRQRTGSKEDGAATEYTSEKVVRTTLYRNGHSYHFRTIHNFPQVIIELDTGIRMREDQKCFFRFYQSMYSPNGTYIRTDGTTIKIRLRLLAFSQRAVRNAQRYLIKVWENLRGMILHLKDEGAMAICRIQRYIVYRKKPIPKTIRKEAEKHAFWSMGKSAQFILFCREDYPVYAETGGGLVFLHITQPDRMARDGNLMDVVNDWNENSSGFGTIRVRQQYTELVLACDKRELKQMMRFLIRHRERIDGMFQEIFQSYAETLPEGNDQKSSEGDRFPFVNYEWFPDYIGQMIEH